MKTYSKAPGVDDCIAAVRQLHHRWLDHVHISSLFAFDPESGNSVLTHQGYPALAVVKIHSLKDRALGLADASIIVDRASWVIASAAQRNAVIDHELTHLVPMTDEDTGGPLCDSLDRPKIEIRKHDHQMGWFDEVAQRHGASSIEVIQATRLMESSRQLYFDFGSSRKANAAP